MVSQITCVSIAYLNVCSDADQRKHKSSASLAFVRGINRWPVNSPHKGPVTPKMFQFMTSSCTAVPATHWPKRNWFLNFPLMSVLVFATQINRCDSDEFYRIRLAAYILYTQQKLCKLNECINLIWFASIKSAITVDEGCTRCLDFLRTKSMHRVILCLTTSRHTDKHLNCTLMLF